MGHSYEVEGGRAPDAFCSRCFAWCHIGPRCTAAVPRCSPCEEGHRAADHRHPIDGKCRNCQGPHLSQANVCPEKRDARQVAKGWRSPPPRRQRGTPPPPDNTPSGAPASSKEVEVGMEEDPVSEGGCRNSGRWRGMAGCFFSFLFLCPSVFALVLLAEWEREKVRPHHDGMVARGLLRVAPDGDRTWEKTV